jgi:hypothetical protein
MSKDSTEMPSPGNEPAPPCPESYALTKCRAKKVGTRWGYIS